MTVSGTPRDIARARAYLGYLNREVPAARHSVGACLFGAGRARGGLRSRLSFSIARLLGEALRVSVGPTR